MKINLFLTIRLTLLSIACLISPTLIAQHTMSFDKKEGSPAARIDDVAWIAGHWKGEAMGGFTEEIWSPPSAGSMMASFKFSDETSVKFYELELISEIEGTLILQLKHFHANLMGWEEKDETVDFKLVKIMKEAAYFDGMTFEKVGDDKMNVYVVIGDNGKSEEVKFSYKRFIDK